LKPARLPSVRASQTYFVTTSTHQKRFLLQGQAFAELLLETIFFYRSQGRFRLHAFVIMPNHFHLVITPGEESTLERSLQVVKGGFSYRVRTELGRHMEIWQRGFTDRRIRDSAECAAIVRYIHENPVKANLVQKAVEFPYSSINPKFQLDPLPPNLSG
jgi:putative transposase